MNAHPSLKSLGAWIWPLSFRELILHLQRFDLYDNTSLHLLFRTETHLEASLACMVDLVAVACWKSGRIRMGAQ